jgi:PST family polysaccharide transporter
VKSRLQPADVIDTHRGESRADGGSSGAMGKGARWIGLSQTVIQVLRVVTTLVLTQLLTPAEFGIVALVTVVSGFFERVVGDTGTSSAIVQRPTLTHGLASSILFLNLGIGFLTSLLFFVAATPISILLGSSDTIGFVRVVGLLAFINSFTYVPQALFRRTLQFQKLATANLANAAVTGFTSIGFAVADFGAWSIVYGNLSGSVVGVIVAWALGSWRPAWYFSRSDLADISTFSAYLSAKNLFGYITFAGDRFVVGRLLGVTDLGFYGLANRLMRYPTQIVAQTYRSTVFPGLARLQDDIEATANAYRRSVSTIALLVFPLSVAVAAVAEPLVSLALPPAWEPVAPVLAIIACTSGLQAVAGTTGSLYTARGRTDLAFRWQVGSSIVYMICYLLGALWGVSGVAGGYLVGTLILIYPAFAIPLGLINVSVRPVLGEATVTATVAAVSGAGAYGVVQLLAGRGLADLLQIVAGLAVIGLGFGLYILFGRPTAFKDLLGLLDARRR